MNNTGGTLMDITLHVGAHRCASTSFQHYVRDHHDELNERGIGYWGPRRMRGGLMDGLFPGPMVARGRNMVRRAEGRMQLNVTRCRRNGVGHLLVSDENLIGTMRGCLRTKTLFPAIGERMARISSAFGGQIGRIVLSIRAPDLWWSSAAAYTVSQGHSVPSRLSFEMMSQSPRSWRDVITDLACAVPSAQIIITPFEQFAGQPEAMFEACFSQAAPTDRVQHWRNRTPALPKLRAILAEQGADPDQLPDRTDRWRPFTPHQSALLRENYADDMHWLYAGADGLATLATDPTRIKTGTSLHAGLMTEGQRHDSRQENMARTG